jgi:hypothetical protein
MPTLSASVEVMLSTLNATEVGTLESLAEKLREVREQLEALDERDLAARADAATAALVRGEVAEFRRIRAYLQSKIGHLRSRVAATLEGPGRRHD